MRFCTLSSGSSGNSSYIEAGDARILVDAGLSCRRICELLRSVGGAPESVSAILITHEHVDHIRGIDVLSKKYCIPVYANAACWGALRYTLSGVLPQNVRVFESDSPFYLGSVRVLPFTTPHDAVHPVGYRFEQGGQRLAVMTDVGHVDARILELLSGSELVLLEANHDVDMLMAGSYPYQLKKRILSGTGHLCNEDCGRTLAQLYKSGLKRALLGHLSSENNDPDLALATVKSVLAGLDAGEVELEVAGRSAPSKMYDLGA